MDSKSNVPWTEITDKLAKVTNETSCGFLNIKPYLWAKRLLLVWEGTLPQTSLEEDTVGRLGLSGSLE